MGKLIKFILTIGILVIVLGGVLLGVAFATNGFKNKSIEEKTYEIEGEFENIEIDLLTSNLEILKSEDANNKLVYDSLEGYSQEFKVSENKLIIKEIDELKWYQKIFNFNFKTTNYKLYLNSDTFGDLKVDASTGNVKYDSFNFDDLQIDVSTGDVSITNSTITSNLKIEASTGNVSITNSTITNDVIIETSTGNITLTKVNANKINLDASTGNIKLIETVSTGELKIDVSTGNVKLDKADGNTIEIETSTGNVTGTILTAKTFVADSDTGSVSVPSTTGNTCKISTSTGNIKITIA